MAKTVAFAFDATHAGLDIADLKPRLGGKGANLWHMSQKLDLRVPEGFTIVTDETFNHEGKKVLRAPLRNRIQKMIDKLESDTNRAFGDPASPLLVSVRSGSAVSMPGMMETVLNLGMTQEVVERLASDVDEMWAWDSYRRFVQMYGTIVLGVDPAYYADRTRAAHRFFGSKDLDVEFIQLLVREFLRETPVPTDPMGQLHQAVLAVFRSWFMPKATKYREIEGIPDDLGTAVNVQRMVFGNLNQRSGTGVAFTRNPNTGEPVHFGDFLAQAQGEDVVDGSHATSPLSDMPRLGFPEAYEELTAILNRLDAHHGDMCDVEFTIENNNLYILQTRIGKRAAPAERRIVVDLLAEGRIDADAAHRRLEAIWGTSTATGLQDASEFDGTVVGFGLAASPGIAIGEIVTTSEAAVAAASEGRTVILVRPETSPDDVDGMAKSAGVLTTTGGLVSHAAVVARGWNIPCVVGFADLNVKADGVHINGKHYPVGTLIKIDGSTGEVSVEGESEASPVPPSSELTMDEAINFAHAGDVGLFIPEGGEINDCSEVADHDYPVMIDDYHESNGTVHVQWVNDNPANTSSYGWWVDVGFIQKGSK